MVGRSRRWAVVGCSALVMALLAINVTGCSKSEPMGTVEGSVTLDGEPYANASVVFLSLTAGQGATGDIQSGGRFKLTTPIPVATYTAFLAPKLDPSASDEQPVTIDQSVPDKYWNEAASDISINVSEGPNSVQVQLEG